MFVLVPGVSSTNRTEPSVAARKRLWERRKPDWKRIDGDYPGIPGYFSQAHAIFPNDLRTKQSPSSVFGDDLDHHRLLLVRIRLGGPCTRCWVGRQMTDVTFTLLSESGSKINPHST
jgi:hypothetical protein